MLKLVHSSKSDLNWDSLLQEARGNAKIAQILAQGLRKGENTGEMAIKIALYLLREIQGR